MLTVLTNALSVTLITTICLCLTDITNTKVEWSSPKVSKGTFQDATSGIFVGQMLISFTCICCPVGLHQKEMIVALCHGRSLLTSVRC